MNSAVFREYDIRGIADQDLSEDFAYKLGQAYAAFTQKRLSKKNLKVSVGRDCRLSGEKYARSLIDGLLSAGVTVLDLSLISTPVSYFSVFHLNLDGAIMVTGSHNPPNYNGFKICVGKSTIYGSDIQELYKLMQKGFSGNSNLGQANTYEIIPEYIDYITGNIKLARPLKIIIDAGNGAAGPIAPQLYKKLGCEVVELFCEPDGRFPNHEADPTVEKNLQDLIAAVKKQKPALGIAFDGDADRIGSVDETGRILWGDELMVLFSRDILKNNPGATIISEVKSSNRLYNDIKGHGGSGIMWKTGHSLIKAKMKESKALLAGEMSGHMFFADRYFGYDDAIYAGARLLEIVAKNNKPLSALLTDLPPAFSTPEIRVDCADDKKWQVVDKIKTALQKKFKTIDIDGVRVEWSDAWGLVRASNTQPVIVMRFEAVSEGRLKEIMSTIKTEARLAGLSI